MARPNRKLPTLSEQELQLFRADILQGQPDECWPWQGARTDDGYGIFRLYREGDEKPLAFLAHRLAFFLEYGEDPGQLCILHRCDNPPCCHPRHLISGTRRQNCQDRTRKGRTPQGDQHGLRRHPEAVLRGLNHPHVKLTEDQVREIRRSHAAGEMGYIKLGKKYGVAAGTIQNICNGNTWKHLDSAPASTLTPEIAEQEQQAKSELRKMMRPKRACRGEQQHAAKLTDEKVREIRRIYASGEMGCHRLAKRYGVSKMLIRLVVHGRIWKHVT